MRRSRGGGGSRRRWGAGGRRDLVLRLTAFARVRLAPQFLPRLSARIRGGLTATTPTAAAFKKFFPTAPSAFVNGSLRKQCERTRDVIVPEIEKSPAASPLLAYAEALAGGAKAALAALAARAKAKGALAGEANDVLEWKEGINLLRTTTHAELIKRAAEQSLGRTWPQDFFRQAGDAAAADGEAPAPEPKPAPLRPIKDARTGSARCPARRATDATASDRPTARR